MKPFKLSKSEDLLEAQEVQRDLLVLELKTLVFIPVPMVETEVLSELVLLRAVLDLTLYGIPGKKFGASSVSYPSSADNESIEETDPVAPSR